MIIATRGKKLHFHWPHNPGTHSIWPIQYETPQPADHPTDERTNYGDSEEIKGHNGYNDNLD